MARYILKRIFSAILTIWFVMTITFILMKSIPGDPFRSEQMADPEIRYAMEVKYGFDQPIHKQYIKYIGDYLKGDFGISFQRVGLGVNEIIEAGFPYSLRIGLLAAVVIIFFGVGFGVLAALRQNRPTDRGLMLFSTLGSTIPNFVFATLYLYLFSKTLNWVPSYGISTPKSYIGPVLVLSVFHVAYLTRLVRSSMLDTLGQNYIRTARAKGLSEWKVIMKHALRNGILPAVTYVGPMFAGIITGSLIVEKVFVIPGIGSLFTQSILNRDYTMIMGITVFFAIILVICVLIIDIIYVFIDPRIKYE